MGLSFHETVRGARFFDTTVPKIAESLEKIAKQLESKEEPESEPLFVCLCQNTYEGTVATINAAALNRAAAIEWYAKLMLNMRERGFSKTEGRAILDEVPQVYEVYTHNTATLTVTIRVSNNEVGL